MDWLAVFFVLPGRIMAEIAYLFPAKGKVWETARQRNNVFIHVMYSVGLYAIIAFGVTQCIKQRSDSQAGNVALSSIPTNPNTVVLSRPSSPSSTVPAPAEVPLATDGSIRTGNSVSSSPSFKTSRVIGNATFSQFAQSEGQQASKAFSECADVAEDEGAALQCERGEMQAAMTARSDFLTRSEEPDEKQRMFDVSKRIAQCGVSENLTDSTCRLVSVLSSNYAQGIRPQSD